MCKYIYISISIYYTLHYYFILLYLICCQLISNLLMGNSFCFFLCPFYISPIIGFFFFFFYFFPPALLSCEAIQNSLCSFCIFPVPVLDSVISSMIPGLFYWKIILKVMLETKMWVLAMLLVSGIFWRLRSSSWQNKEIHEYNTYLCIFLCITICIYIK